VRRIGAALAGALLMLVQGVPSWAQTAVPDASTDAAPQEERAADALYPEGPLIVGDALLYAEMTGDRITKVTRQGLARWPMPSGCGPTAIAPYGEGRFAVFCHLAGGIVLVSDTGTVIASLAEDVTGARISFPNDAHEDRRGGVYFSSSGPFSPHAQPVGRLMHLAADGQVRTVAEGLSYPNGVFVTPEGIIFVSEHMGKRILRFRAEVDGAVSPLPDFADYRTLGLAPPGAQAFVGPDGIEVASDGTVYVCIYGAGKALVLTPEGRLSGAIDAETLYLTNIALSETTNSAFLTGAFDNIVHPYHGKVVAVPLP